MDTADNIWNTCERNNIDGVSGLTKLVGNVLLGLLPPSEFQKELETELKLTSEVVKKVFHEINRFIFYPVQIELSKLYPTEAMPTATIQTPAAKSPASEKAEIGPTPEKPTEKKDDTYREPLK